MSCNIKDGKYYDNEGNESKLFKDLEELVGSREANDLFILSHTPSFFLTRTQSIDLQKEIESKYVPSGGNPFNMEYDDLRLNVFNYENPIASKDINGVNLRITDGLVREKKKTYLLYANGQIIGEFPTVQIIKDTIKNIENRLIKEPTVKEVLLYANDNFSSTLPLTSEEKFELSTLQIKDVENSEDLYDLLNDMFFKDNLFDPQVKKLEKIYTDVEIKNILEDVEVQARIKETVEKLRFTDSFPITEVKEDKNYGYKELSFNIIGQYKSQIDKPIRGVEIEAIDEEGNTIENKLIYDNAVRQVDEPKIVDAIETVINAPKNVETKKVEKKVITWLKDFGLDVSNLAREKYVDLLNFINSPTEQNTISLEQSLGFTRTPKVETIDIKTPLNRTYKYLLTTKTEQELFDELSLIRTNTENVYHRINKIDEQEMRSIQNNQDLITPIYQLYKDYYGYNENFEEESALNMPILDYNYLTEEFVADFNAEKLINPNSFNKLFKITEKGIELVSYDDLTIAKIKSQIESYSELKDYSIVSKTLPDFRDYSELIVSSKENRRLNVVNNKTNIPVPISEIEIIDEQFIKAPRENAEWLKIGEDIYEQQEAGIYSKLQFEESPYYYTFKISVPEYRVFENKETEMAEKETKKLTDKKTDEENFSCL